MVLFGYQILLLHSQTLLPWKKLQVYCDSMKIGYDAKRLFHNKTGLGVYSRLLVRGLADLNDSNDYFLFVQKPERSKYFSAFKDLTIISSKKIAWRTFGMAKEIANQACDLFHGLSHELPLGIRKTKVPTVVTMHDVIFKKDPSLYPFIDRNIYDLKWRHSCKVADKIIAVSTHTKNDLIDIYKVKEHRIVVIPPPVSDVFLSSDPEPSMITERYNLPKQFILYVGTINARKNLLGILKAMKILPNAIQVPLVVVGTGLGTYIHTVNDFVHQQDLSHLVHFVGQIPNTDLPRFYHAATALVYPSYYEGFGIPIVEALVCGTPVITSKTSSMPEAGGPGALLIHPDSTEQIAQAIETIITNTDIRLDLINEGCKYVNRFAKEKIATDVMGVYQEILNINLA